MGAHYSTQATGETITDNKIPSITSDIAIKQDAQDVSSAADMVISADGVHIPVTQIIDSPKAQLHEPINIIPVYTDAKRTDIEIINITDTTDLSENILETYIPKNDEKISNECIEPVKYEMNVSADGVTITTAMDESKETVEDMDTQSVIYDGKTLETVSTLSDSASYKSDEPDVEHRYAKLIKKGRYVRNARAARKAKRQELIIKRRNKKCKCKLFVGVGKKSTIPEWVKQEYLNKNGATKEQPICTGDKLPEWVKDEFIAGKGLSNRSKR
ncbi:MAG: hypothetical protein Faunusvirus8_14 [Faunusvirus sp.]|jgi:hypothetical protein|uniref:Uncharacterized protein n=1 Tax=Faunusvirus sp. TaxID=2487766 RepID=A0A3G4ZWK9_9VIRU|nr:MAG: hypothetical protein Faunusvirus8_14 [Faunusvirus sp.]